MNSSVKVFDFPVRDGKTLRNFDFILPKFHFTLPKFCFSPRWKIKNNSVEIYGLLRGDQRLQGTIGDNLWQKSCTFVTAQRLISIIWI